VRADAEENDGPTGKNANDQQTKNATYLHMQVKSLSSMQPSQDDNSISKCSKWWLHQQ